MFVLAQKSHSRWLCSHQAGPALGQTSNFQKTRSRGKYPIMNLILPRACGCASLADRLNTFCIALPRPLIVALILLWSFGSARAAMPPAPLEPLPSANQLAWMDNGLTLFTH